MVRLGDALGIEIRPHLGEHAVASGGIEIGRDNGLRVGLGRLAGQTELAGGPQTHELVAPRMRLEPQFLIVSELVLENLLTLVEGRHDMPLAAADIEIHCASPYIMAGGRQGRAIACASWRLREYGGQVMSIVLRGSLR